MTPNERMNCIDALLSHVWMVRTFLKHCEEAEDDETLREIHRELYDCMLALGPAYSAGDADRYLKTAHKKLARLRRAAQQFQEHQPEASTHMNFQMAVRSLATAVDDVARLLEQA